MEGILGLLHVSSQEDDERKSWNVKQRYYRHLRIEVAEANLTGKGELGKGSG